MSWEVLGVIFTIMLIQVKVLFKIFCWETDLSNGVDNILQTGFTTQDTKRYESDYYIQDAAFIRLIMLV
jgi:hypothetical protein